MLPLFVLELVEPEVELEFEELELLDEPVLEESDASGSKRRLSLPDSLFVDWDNLQCGDTAWSPNHFFWITLITPPFFKEPSASDTAFCSSTLVVGAAMQ